MHDFDGRSKNTNLNFLWDDKANSKINCTHLKLLRCAVLTSIALCVPLPLLPSVFHCRADSSMRVWFMLLLCGDTSTGYRLLCTRAGIPVAHMVVLVLLAWLRPGVGQRLAMRRISMAIDFQNAFFIGVLSMIGALVEIVL